MTVWGLTVSDASIYAPGLVWLRWQADRNSIVDIKIDGKSEGGAGSHVGANEELISFPAGTHSVCVEET